VYVTLWAEGFADLSDAVLEAAFRETLATCKFWPVKIADVREHVESAEECRTEDDWHAVLEYCQRYVHPDLGVRGPKLPPDISHAAAAAGGLFYLESCSEHDLIFAKERFITDLARQRKSGDVARYLPSSELQRVLEAAAPRFALPRASENLPNRDAGHSEAFSRPLLQKVERAADLAALIREGEALWRASRGGGEPRLPEPMVVPK
jgi:hypothetical protein